MKSIPDFDSLQQHDPDDPNPWQAFYLDRSTPFSDEVKAAWLRDSSSASRQYLLPVLRPICRAVIVLIQLIKIVLPKEWKQSTWLHQLVAWGLKSFVRPEANWLILRHFHLGSQILAFIAANAPVQIPTNPLKPTCLDDLTDHLFVKHDLNLFNFIINLNRELRQSKKTMCAPEKIDFSMISEPELRLVDLPDTRWNFLDLQSAIELFTPVYQLLLTDNDFWRAVNSLQLDETIGLYAAHILQAPQHLILVNNKHPLVPLSTLRAGSRLVLHGLSTEMLHALLMQHKQMQAAQHRTAPIV